MSTLDKIAKIMGTDKSTKRHGYTGIYEKHISKKRDSSISLLEIGVAYGQSLLTWKDYFRKGHIVGLDSFARDPFDKPSVKKKILSDLDHKRISVVIGDQTHSPSIDKAIGLAGGSFDIIIDDASHVSEDQQWTLGYLFNYLKPGGLYVIEDLQTKRTNNMSIDGSPAERTLKMINRFSKTGVFESKVLDEDTCKEISNGTKWCKVYQNKISFMRKSL